MKTFLLVLATVSVMLGCAACGRESKKSKTISEEQSIDLVNALQDGNLFDDALTQVEENVVIQSYRITDSSIKVIVCYMGDGASAEEITVLKGDKQQIKELTEEYLKNKADSYRDYLPAEADKVENAVVKQYGDVTILCISRDSKAAEKLLK